MVEVDVDVVGTELLERSIQIFNHVRMRHAALVGISVRADHVGMTALGDKRNLITLAAAGEPIAQHALCARLFVRYPVGIDMRAVNQIAALAKIGIKNAVSVCAVPAQAGVNSAKADGIDREVCSWDQKSLFHCVLLSNMRLSRFDFTWGVSICSSSVFISSIRFSCRAADRPPDRA